MAPPTNSVSAHLRTATSTIVHAWAREATHQLPALRRLEPAALVDHVPEVLHALAAWVDGDELAGRRGFDRLADGHAVQRLGFGIDLATLCAEYQILRGAILEELLAVPSSDAVRAALIRLNAGLDQAVAEGLRRYALAREQERDRFVSILGHDLRNPLNAMTLGAATLQATPCGDPRHLRLADTIQRSGDRMQRLIGDVLDAAQAQLGGGLPTVPRPCDLAELCRDAAAELRLAHPGRDLRVTSHGDLRGAWDRDRVLQAISNLLANALQHGADPIEVVAREADDKGAVITEVRNRGPAIAPELLARLFEPFARGGRPPAAGHRSGIGLGLYIVHQIALAHGAAIDVRSQGDRTTVTITWPRVQLADDPRAAGGDDQKQQESR